MDYILNDPDGQLDKFGNLVVQVTDPRKVVLYGIKCSDDYAVRAELARVVTDNEPFEFGRYIGQEEFIVQLQSRFIETDNSLEVGQGGWQFEHREGDKHQRRRHQSACNGA